MNMRLDHNQQHLSAEFTRVHGYLDQEKRQTGDVTRAYGVGEAPALVRLCAAFGLTPFERDVLVLCAGVVLDSAIAEAVAAREPGGQPTWGLALAALPGAHWSALLPQAALRRWHMLEVGISAHLTHTPLHIDERMQHHLLGLDYLDERLNGVVRLAEDSPSLCDSQQRVAETLAQLLGQGGNGMQLCEADAATRQAIAAAACEKLGAALWVAKSGDLPHAPAERATFARLWEREALLAGRVLLIECAANADLSLLDELRAPCIIATDEPLMLPAYPRLAVPLPTAAEHHAIWLAALGPLGSTLNGQVDALASQFRLSAAEINSIARGASADNIWQRCRATARTRLNELAQRVEAGVGWNDLVLPEGHLATLREITVHVRRRTTVYETWGFAAKSGRGLGISALFAGPSGTGKTLAAEVIANELQLDLFRIDLSQVVSKYIGETEKNLRRVFAAAENSGAVLLFDEADALFGKRSEVKDSHDRYANIEVGYLLQQMEAYRGLAILTTNLRSALDTAFLRRIRFVVEFPFPDAAGRAAIWQKTIPAAVPTAELAFEKLARLHVAGGNIRNIAMNAAFLAADTGEPLRMAHLLRAARAECAKIEKPLSEAEVAGW